MGGSRSNERGKKNGTYGKGDARFRMLRSISVKAATRTGQDRTGVLVNAPQRATGPNAPAIRSEIVYAFAYALCIVYYTGNHVGRSTLVSWRRFPTKRAIATHKNTHYPGHWHHYSINAPHTHHATHHCGLCPSRWKLNCPTHASGIFSTVFAPDCFLVLLSCQKQRK